MPRSRFSLPVSLHQETRLLKKFVDVPEVKGELGALIAKAIATLDWLLENGTPGTKLGAAQTVLMPFVPRAPQTVENLNYDVANLAPEQQDHILRLAKEYRSVVGSAPAGRGAAESPEDRRAQAQALFLSPPPAGDDAADVGAGWDDAVAGPRESGAGPDPRWGEQEREEYLGND